MTQISVKYNPYRLTTEIKVNGNDISEDRQCKILFRFNTN